MQNVKCGIKWTDKNGVATDIVVYQGPDGEVAFEGLTACRLIGTELEKQGVFPAIQWYLTAF